MYQARHEGGFTIIRALGELGRAELAELAALAARVRRSGRLVVLDLEKVTHLHYRGAYYSMNHVPKEIAVEIEKVSAQA